MGLKLILVYGAFVLLAGLVDRWWVIWRFRNDESRRKID